MVCFATAGLSSILPRALWDWSWRTMPVVVLVTLAAIFARNLKVAAVLSIVGVMLSSAINEVPQQIGEIEWQQREFPGANTQGGWIANQAPRLAVPAGAEMKVSERLTQLAVDSRVVNKVVQEKFFLSSAINILNLPPDTVVADVDTTTIKFAIPSGTITTNGGFMRDAMSGNRPRIPLSELRDDAAHSDRYGNLNTGLEPTEFAVSSAHFSQSPSIIPDAGGEVSGIFRVKLAKRRVLATLPVEQGASWQAGLNKLTVDKAAENTLAGYDISLHLTQSNILADPYWGTSGLNLTKDSLIVLWIEHLTQPHRILDGTRV